MSLLIPEPTGLARGLDGGLLDRSDDALEPVGIARADRDKAGRPQHAMTGRQVRLLLEEVLRRGRPLRVLDLPAPPPLSRVRDVLVLLPADVTRRPVRAHRCVEQRRSPDSGGQEERCKESGEDQRAWPGPLIVQQTQLPAGAAFWMPKPDEVSEEGFSFLRDVWLIRGVRVGDAREVIDEERRIVDVVDRLSADADDFEKFAAVAESGGIDDPAYELTRDQYATLSTVVSDVPAELGGLELGVAGLVHALVSVRILPAASCRSHPQRNWSDAPVVLFAATEYRARALQPLVAESGCTFTIDSARSELLCIRGESITRTMALAELVLAHRRDFVQVKPRRVARKRPPPESEQVALF